MDLIVVVAAGLFGFVLGEIMRDLRGRDKSRRYRFSLGVGVRDAELNIESLGVGESIRGFCGLDRRHRHYTIILRFYDEVSRTKHYLRLWYCPLLQQILQREPEPKTPDEIIYGETYEVKANHWGE